MSALELLSALVVGTGVFFVAIGAIGFIRLPDVFCRLHVTGVVDTLGAPMIMLGAAIYLGAQLVSLKLLLGIGFLVITSPLLGHLLARAALEAGHKPQRLDEDTGSYRVVAGEGPGRS
jgi:multicomponent Na+:H+ antiporter subunit G